VLRALKPRPGDLNPAVLETVSCATSPASNGGYKALAEGGWIGLSSTPDYGGMGLPMALNTADERVIFRGRALLCNWWLCSAKARSEALEITRTDALKDLYCPADLGEWNAR